MMIRKYLFHIVLFSYLLVASRSSYAQGGNGMERGGGDDYVAEFRKIKNSIDSRINLWVKSGALSLTSSELDQYIHYSSTIDIYSSNRVYINDNDPSTDGVIY